MNFATPDIIIAVFQLAILFFSVVIHEISHGYAALMLGDHTAESAGRLTLNPVRHFDFFGMVLLPIFSVLVFHTPVGYAKPVPYNPYNLKNQRWGAAIVGAAGPAANLLVALIFGLVVRGLLAANTTFLFSPFVQFLAFIVFVNLWLAVFNLIPIPPIDGSKVVHALLPFGIRQRLSTLGYQSRGFFSQYWIVLILFLFIFGGSALSWVLGSVLSPIAGGLFTFITGLPIGAF